MAETPEPPTRLDQHNHGPGIFIAGDVIGDVHHHSSPRPTFRHTGHIEEHESVGGPGRDGRVPVNEEPSGEEGRPGPLKSLIGNAFGAFMLFGMAGYSVAITFMPTHPTSERVISIPLAAGLALGGLVPLASSLAVLAELCAAGAANAAHAAGSAGKRGRDGRRTAVRLNLRHAHLLARTAHYSAVLAGFVTALIAFRAASGRAADRAQEAGDRAESEVAKARAVLQQSDPAAGCVDRRA
ncbi:hypothetical protein [Streptomyces viridochromogenes]|uniref:hypothetical protein n=1 Tax=Streptomyces viridochromogenes TaxID=1938 RepID=UPI00131A0F29|nr:hypothetical protein [Streptomyces viridochromogenes]